MTEISEILRAQEERLLAFIPNPAKAWNGVLPGGKTKKGKIMGAAWRKSNDARTAEAKAKRRRRNANNKAR